MTVVLAKASSGCRQEANAFFSVPLASKARSFALFAFCLRLARGHSYFNATFGLIFPLAPQRRVRQLVARTFLCDCLARGQVFFNAAFGLTIPLAPKRRVRQLVAQAFLCDCLATLCRFWRRC